MAAKSLVKVSFDWSKVMSAVSKSDATKLNKLKAQFDATSAKVASLPGSLPSIDWSYYKENAVDPKLVEEIQKGYSSLKVDRPKAAAQQLQQLDKAQEQDRARYARFVKVAQSYIESAEVVKRKFEKMIPVREMSEEDWSLTFPEWSLSIESPSISPHYEKTAGLTPEERAAFEQPDPVPFATKAAWKDWEERKKTKYGSLAPAH